MENNGYGLCEILISFEDKKWKVTWKKLQNVDIQLESDNQKFLLTEEEIDYYFDKIDFIWTEPLAFAFDDFNSNSDYRFITNCINFFVEYDYKYEQLNITFEGKVGFISYIRNNEKPNAYWMLDVDLSDVDDYDEITQNENQNIIKKLLNLISDFFKRLI